MPTSTISPTHLILICCHAIYTGGPTNGISEKEWLLAPFQTSEAPTFTSHIQTGLRILSSDPLSLLIFSGSKTRPEVDLSEARSYLNLCLEWGFWGIISPDEALGPESGLGDGKEKGRIRRMLLEEQALDSFGNLVFSVIRFWREVGSWPKKVTVVSHGFKRARFLDLHIKGMRWPRERVEFLGIDPGYLERGEDWDEVRAERVLRGEQERGYEAWREDLRGTGEGLREKRGARNRWGVNQVLFESEEERRRSGVRSQVVDYGRGVMEEVLDEKQPWED